MNTKEQTVKNILVKLLDNGSIPFDLDVSFKEDDSDDSTTVVGLSTTNNTGTNTNFANLGYLRNIDLSNKALVARTVNDITYSTIIKGCDITGIKLAGTDLDRANLSGCTYGGGLITKTQLASLGALNTDTVIINTYTGIPVIDLYYATLNNVNLAGSDLTYANLSGAILSGANLPYADLSYTNLTNARINGANLSGASLYRAILTGADLTNANLTRANLFGAILTGAILANANLDGAILANATINGTIVTKAQLANLGALNTDTIIGIN